MKEHSDDAKGDLEGSHIAVHLKTAHPQEWKELGMERDGWLHFSVKIVKTHQTAFRRQLHEAVSINMETGVLLNNLEEYSRCLVPTLEIKGAKKETPKAKEMRMARMETREAEADLVMNNNQETRGKRMNISNTQPHNKRSRTSTHIHNETHAETHMTLHPGTQEKHSVRENKRKRNPDTHDEEMRTHTESEMKRPASETQSQHMRRHKPKNQETDEHTHRQQQKTSTARAPSKQTTVPSKSKPKLLSKGVNSGTNTRDIRQFLVNNTQPESDPIRNKTFSTATGDTQGPSKLICKSKSTNYPKLITRNKGQAESNRPPRTSLDNSQYSICSIFKPLTTKSSSRTPRGRN